MTDEELVSKLFNAYRDHNWVSPEEFEVIKSVILFMVKAVRQHPLLPEGMDGRKDNFTRFDFLVHHLENGNTKINATSMTSVGKTPEDLNTDVAILRHYLDTVTSIDHTPATAH